MPGQSSVTCTHRAWTSSSVGAAWALLLPRSAPHSPLRQEAGQREFSPPAPGPGSHCAWPVGAM